MRKRFAMARAFEALAAAVLGVAAAAAAQEPPFQTYTGSYENPEYCYRITLAPGAVGLANGRPGPHPGFFIDLTATPASSLQEVWNHPSQRLIHVGAVADPGSKLTPGKAADRRRTELEQDKAHVLAFHRKDTRLGSLPAVRVSAVYESPGTMLPTVEETIFARGDGRLFELTLLSTASRFHEDDAIFEGMARSWRALPCPAGKAQP
jgi:hypothetical protein